MIIDAGGGTIDISAYTVLDNGPLRVEESYEPQCESCQSSSQMLLFDSFHFRFTARRGVCHGEGESDGQKYALTLYSQIDY